MSDVVIFDPENREIRAVWRTFKSRVARLLSYDPAVDVRRSVRPGQTLFTVTWADGSTDEVIAPTACAGVVKTVRYKKGPYSDLSLRPSAVLIELVDAADRGSRDIAREPSSGTGAGDPTAGIGPGAASSAEDDGRPPEPPGRGKASLERVHRKDKKEAAASGLRPPAAAEAAASGLRPPAAAEAAASGLRPPAAAEATKRAAHAKKKPPAKKRGSKKQQKT